MSESPPKRARFLVPAAVFTLLVIAVHADPLFFRRNFAGRDLLIYNLPMEKTIHDAYASGALPRWSPGISGGRPLLPNPNAGALYPLRPILSLLPFPAAMRIFPVFHWVAAGLGMLLLLGTLGVSRSGALVGAVTFAFSGVSVAEVFFPNVQPGMALLPWVVWGVARRSASEAGKTVLLAVLFGLLMLAGDVFTTGMALGAASLWILCDPARGNRGLRMGHLVLSFLLGCLLAAPQIVATLLWIPETSRAAIGMTVRDSVFFSISPWRLFELAVPFPFGANWTLDDWEVWGWPVFRQKGMGIFTTLYAGAFAVVALALRWRNPPPAVRFARLLILLSLAASVLPSLLPQAWERLPSPLPLRNPEKFGVGLVVGLAMLAGLAFDELRRRRRRPAWVLSAFAGIALVAAVAALFPATAGGVALRLVGGEARLAERTGHLLAMAFAEGGLLWATMLAGLDLLPRPSAIASFVSAGLFAAIPVVANARIARTLSEEEVFSPPRFASWLQKTDPAGAGRTLSESLYYPGSRLASSVLASQPELPGFSWLHHRHVLWNRGTVFNRDIDVGDLSRAASLRRLSVLAAGHRDPEAFFGSLALRWGVRFRDQRPLAGYRRIGGDGFQEWDELPSALPDVRLVESWREETGPVRAAVALPDLRRGEVVLETGLRRRGIARPGVVRVLERSPGRLVVESEAPGPGWLFVLRGFWRYREVLVDGERVECVPAQLAFSAVPVPAGRHIVQWTELVPGLAVSRFGPVIAAGALALLWMRDRRNRMRPA